MSTANAIGEKLVALCKEGKGLTAIEELYADDIVSVEAAQGPGMDRQQSGKQAVIGKTTWWEENHDVHSSEVTGPFPHGDDKFAVIFDIDVTFKPESRRSQLKEIAVYQVADGKVVREEFFYSM